MNKEELIKAKKEQLQALKREIRELEGGNSIATCTTKEVIFGVICDRKDGKAQPLELDVRKTPNTIWDHIRLLSQSLYMEKNTTGWGGNRHRYMLSNVKKVKDMTPEQMKLSARFCDEIIPIFNKYVVEANPTMDFFGVTCTPWDKFDLSELI